MNRKIVRLKNGISTIQITNPIIIRILKWSWVDLIERSCFPPWPFVIVQRNKIIIVPEALTIYYPNSTYGCTPKSYSWHLNVFQSRTDLFTDLDWTTVECKDVMRNLFKWITSTDYFSHVFSLIANILGVYKYVNGRFIKL